MSCQVAKLLVLGCQDWTPLQAEQAEAEGSKGQKASRFFLRLKGIFQYIHVYYIKHITGVHCDSDVISSCVTASPLSAGLSVSTDKAD